MPTAFITQGNSPAEGWDALVGTKLAGRKNASTDAQIQRLAKTLQRLCPAAIAAVEAVQQKGLMPAAKTQPAVFTSALLAHSDG